MNDKQDYATEVDALRRQRLLLLVVIGVLLALLLAGCLFRKVVSPPRIGAATDRKEIVFPAVPVGATSSDKLVFTYACQTPDDCLFSNEVEGAIPDWKLEGATPDNFRVTLLKRSEKQPPYGLAVTFTPQTSGQSSARLALVHPTVPALTTAINLKGATSDSTPEIEAGELTFSTGVHDFGSGPTECAADGRRELDQWLERAGLSPREAVLIVGHADFRGEDVANQRLALARACFVAGELARRGIDRQRLFVITTGEAASRPHAGADARALCPDRRVELLPLSLNHTAALRAVPCDG